MVAISYPSLGTFYGPSPQKDDSVPGSFGCCDFQISTENKTILCARSMEFWMPMQSEIKVYPRGEKCYSTAPDSSKSFDWISKFGYIGVTALGFGPVEGLNEAGLSFGALTLEGSQYQTVGEDQKKCALALRDIGSWILGNFSTVGEVSEAVRNVKVWGTTVPALNTVPELHFAFHDANGNNLVLEYLDAQAKIHDHPLGVLTNEPPLEFHLENIRQYNYLKADYAEEIEINGAKVPSPGMSSEMNGLPGDWSSPSRFVRIAACVRFGIKPYSSEYGVVLCKHFLNTVDRPKGTAIKRVENSPRLFYETTLWCTIKDLSNKIFYYYSYNNSTLRKIDLKGISFENNKEYKIIKIEFESPTIIDVTKELNSC